MPWLGYLNKLIDFGGQMTVETVPASLVQYTDLSKEYLGKVLFWYDRAIFDRVIPNELRKISIICSFRSFSLHWLHILK
jgi:hypothetical protein